MSRPPWQTKEFERARAKGWLFPKPLYLAIRVWTLGLPHVPPLKLGRK